jgi:hypothetical protein
VQPSVGDNVQLQPLPLMAVAVRLGGNVSVTLTVPDVVVPPLFLAVIT